MAVKQHKGWLARLRHCGLPTQHSTWSATTSRKIQQLEQLEQQEKLEEQEKHQEHEEHEAHEEHEHEDEPIELPLD